MWEEGNVSSCFKLLLSNLIFLGSSCCTRLGGDLLPGCPGGCEAPVLGAVLLCLGGGGDGVVLPAGREVGGGELSSFFITWILCTSCIVIIPKLVNTRQP